MLLARLHYADVLVLLARLQVAYGLVLLGRLQVADVLVFRACLNVATVSAACYDVLGLLARLTFTDRRQVAYRMSRLAGKISLDCD